MVSRLDDVPGMLGWLALGAAGDILVLPFPSLTNTGLGDTGVPVRHPARHGGGDVRADRGTGLLRQVPSSPP